MKKYYSIIAVGILFIITLSSVTISLSYYNKNKVLLSTSIKSEDLEIANSNLKQEVEELTKKLEVIEIEQALKPVLYSEAAVKRLEKEIADLKLELKPKQPEQLEIERDYYKGFSYKYIAHVQYLFEKLSDYLPIMNYDNELEKQCLEACLEYLKNGQLYKEQVVLILNKPGISTVNPNLYSVSFLVVDVISEPTKAEYLPAIEYINMQLLILEHKDNKFIVIEHKRRF